MDHAARAEVDGVGAEAKRAARGRRALRRVAREFIGAANREEEEVSSWSSPPVLL